MADRLFLFAGASALAATLEPRQIIHWFFWPRRARFDRRATWGVAMLD